MTVRAIGYQPYTRDNIEVRLSEATRVDVALSRQAVELAAITVTGGVTPDFSPTRQGVGSQISDTLVRRIPTFSRDFIDQLKLSPQVVYPATGAASGAGAYNRYNTITIDGANQSERFNLSATNGVPGGSASGKIVSLDAVKMMNIHTATGSQYPKKLRLSDTAHRKPGRARRSNHFSGLWLKR